MREEDLIERLSSSSSSESSSGDEGQETVISKPLLLPQKRLLAATTSDDKKKDDNNQAEVEYLYGQNFYQLRDQCLSEDHLFEDPEFPTENDLLRDRSQRYIDDVEWMRPSEIGSVSCMTVPNVMSGCQLSRWCRTCLWLNKALKR